MAIQKSTLINTPTRTVIKYVVTDQAGSPVTDTIALSSIVTTNQTVDGSPVVSVAAVYTSANTPTTLQLTRNSVPVIKTYGTNEFQYIKDASFSIKEESSSDIVVNISDDGTFIIELRKEAGYTFGVDLQNAGV